MKREITNTTGGRRKKGSREKKNLEFRGGSNKGGGKWPRLGYFRGKIPKKEVTPPSELGT